MRRILEANGTPEWPRIYLLLLIVLVVVWRVLIETAMGLLLIGRVEDLFAWQVDFPLHLGLFAFLGASVIVWSAAAMRGRVGVGTGGGFWIASLGLVGRMAGEMLIRWDYDVVPDSAYRQFSEVGAMIWFGRNVTLMAYGFGIACVAISCWADVRMRRRAPEWLRPHV